MSFLSKYTLAFFAASAVKISDKPWANTALSPDERANALIAEMTKDEKIGLLFGDR